MGTQSVLLQLPIDLSWGGAFASVTYGLCLYPSRLQKIAYATVVQSTSI